MSVRESTVYSKFSIIFLKAKTYLVNPNISLSHKQNTEKCDLHLTPHTPLHELIWSKSNFFQISFLTFISTVDKYDVGWKSVTILESKFFNVHL